MPDARAHCPPNDDGRRFDQPDSRSELHLGELAETRMEAERDRASFELGDAHLAAAQWAEACKLFHGLAASHPQNREYRARMHYARGRDYLTARQYRNARAELRRALELDPTLTAAGDALDAATSLLSKLFRR